MANATGQMTKYKAYLLAYKDLEKAEEKDLRYHFISNIANEDRIREDLQGIDKVATGMSFRVGLYHNWFKDEILRKLEEGYKLGIMEIQKSYRESGEKTLEELKEKYNLLIVDQGEM